MLRVVCLCSWDIDFHSSCLVIYESCMVIESTGVHPNALCVPCPCLIECIGQQCAAEAASDEVWCESEVCDLNRMGFVALQLVVTGGGTVPCCDESAKLISKDVALPLLISPFELVDPHPLLADQFVERAIELPLSLDCFAHGEVGVRYARGNDLVGGVHLEVCCDDFRHGGC